MAGRWPRIAVRLAGPYANEVLAGVAALLAPWLPVPEATAALWQFALVSHAVVLVNLCPVFEYDGYHVLSDILDRPNWRRDGLTWLGKNLARLLRVSDLRASKP